MKTQSCRDYRTGGWCSRCEVGDLANCEDRLTITEDKPTRPRTAPSTLAVLAWLFAAFAVLDLVRGLFFLTQGHSDRFADQMAAVTADWIIAGGLALARLITRRIHR